MLTLIIALLMSLNLISSADDYNNMSESEKQEMQEIIIEDVQQF